MRVILGVNYKCSVDVDYNGIIGVDYNGFCESSCYIHYSSKWLPAGLHFIFICARNIVLYENVT